MTVLDNFLKPSYFLLIITIKHEKYKSRIPTNFNDYTNSAN